MGIEIEGYSERGAMNALFYGIAYRKGEGFDGEKAIRELLTLANVDYRFEKITFYLECSLSGFGDPDLVIIGEDANRLKTCMFVEAKASSLGYYDVEEQKIHHENYMNYGEHSKYDKGHSSNLFFQLRLKHLLVNSSSPDIKEGTLLGTEKRSAKRKIGINPIVKKLYNEISQCENRVEYIAIVPALPEDKHILQTKGKYGFDIHLISWQEILKNDFLKKYVEDVFVFNKSDEGKSQILNNK